MSGYLWVVAEPERAEEIADYVFNEPESTFTDDASTRDFHITKPSLCLLSFDGENIDAATIATPCGKVVTLKQRIRFRPIVRLQRVALDEIRRRLDRAYRRHFKIESGEIPSPTWDQIWSALKELTYSVDELGALERERDSLVSPLQSSGYDILSMEKDAIALAADIFDTPRDFLRHWEPPDSGVAPFLQGLEHAVVREDQMVIHDSHCAFPGWIPMPETQIGAIEFYRGDSKLTVMNFNRTPVENTLGVDLLYYHHKYRAYVLVQYKRMTGHPYEYRPDGSYESELARMREFAEALGAHSMPNATPHDYRLHPGAFYWKLCPKTLLSPMSTDLIRGIYLPLDYWATLIDTGHACGPQGGVCVNYNNVVRHINNTLFVQLVQDGWIGSRLQDTDSLTQVLNAVLSGAMEGGNSLVVAISEQTSDNHTDNARSGGGDLED